MPRGTLWETALRDRTPVWLLEWEVSQKLQRRVLVAVDTSDSCAGEMKQLKPFFQALTNALDIGDSCVMFQMGATRKIADEQIRHSQQRPEVVQKMSRLPVGIRGGTWLGQTLNVMLAEAAQAPPNISCSYLVVSDGEIFDVEGVLQHLPESFGLVRLGHRKSHQLSTLAEHAKVLPLAEPALKEFLGASPVSVFLEHQGDSTRVVEFSERGEITRELKMNEALKIGATQNSVSVAYVGGSQPRPRLRYAAYDRSWDEADVECAKLIAGQKPHLDQIVRALEGNQVRWDLGRLKLLANDSAKKQIFRCPSDCRREKRARESLFCTCGSLIVSLDGIKRPDVLRLYRGTICFPVNADVVIDSPSACDSSTGDHAYELENGENPRLVLDLYK
jgi:hypothetical protein